MLNPKQKINHKLQDELAPIPDKLYFTIGEVSRLCALKSHVLRYWEQEFPQLRPSKRRGNRRYYQRKDVLLIRKIRNLLYVQGFTIDGARSQLASDLLKDATIKREQKIQFEPNEPYTKIISELEEIWESLVKGSFIGA
jgi:DNA-binding transcriptional MerR regulator